MIVEIETHLPASPQIIFEHALRPALLKHIAAPLVTFRSLAPRGFPERWIEGQKHEVAMWAFGVAPLGRQTIQVDLTQHEPHVLLLRDRGRGQLARVWDHVISLKAQDGGTLYQDNVLIKAGLLTPFVWLFGIVFYRWRQRRWRELAANGFLY